MQVCKPSANQHKWFENESVRGTLESIISFKRLSSSRAISQFCINISAASFPHNALKLLSLLVHKALYW